MAKSNDDAMLVPFDPTKPSTPISYPIKTLQELKSRSYLDSFHFPFNRSSVSLQRNIGSLPDRSRILVCHDMKGGYVDDKWVQGCGNDAGFAIWNWYLMDVFVYFSHYLVTLPPPCWTNTAHRHGVKVLGTFITENDQGFAVCKELLATKESAQMYAERLAELAVSLGFDGWLLNIENDIAQVQIPNLKEFGLGSHISLGGRNLSDAPWYNISCQSLQPLLEFNEGKNSEMMKVIVDDGREASYNGGGNISFRGNLKRNAHFTARLFKPHLQLSVSPISISYSVKLQERSELGILLHFSSASQETKSLLMAPNESGEMFLPCLLTQTDSDWTVYETSLVLDGHTLTEISAFCYKPKDFINTTEYFALLGHISIKQKTISFPPASSWIIEAHHVELVPGNFRSMTLSCKLEWRLMNKPEESVFTKYNVYAEKLNSSQYKPRKVMDEPRNEKMFLGTAHVSAYYVSDLVVGSDVKEVRFVVQTCGEDGSWQELDASPNLLVEIERSSSKFCCGLI